MTGKPMSTDYCGIGTDSAGVPWWTYDAGGFFDQEISIQTTYHEMLFRGFRPLLSSFIKVHGYMSNTEPWSMES